MDRLPPVTTTRRRKASEDVARAIAAYIVRESLPDGAQLPNEAILQESLGVGRNTLREALRLLETQGTIVIKTGLGGGPVVRTPQPEDLSGSLSLLLQMRRITFDAVVEARLALAPRIAALAAEKIKDAEIAQLRANVEELQARAPLPRDEYLRNNVEFHNIISRACDNLILEIFDATTLRILTTGPMTATYTASRQRQTIRLHTTIVDALAAHDPVAAERALLDHDRVGRDWLQKQFRDEMGQPVRWE